MNASVVIVTSFLFACLQTQTRGRSNLFNSTPELDAVQARENGPEQEDSFRVRQAPTINPHLPSIGC
jgi:hypothetical protein